MKGLNGFINSLFEHHNRLLVIRIDTGYRAGNIIRSKADIDDKYNQAKQDFARFLANLKNHSLFTHKVGHVWKLEYGPEKGFHFHVLLFFNGSQVRQDVTLAKMLGKYWVRSITRGQGVYHNCNGDKESYQRCGIGMIHCREEEKINYLKQAAAYLVKVDHYARMLVPDHDKTFSRSPILPPKTDSRGRPRAA